MTRAGAGLLGVVAVLAACTHYNAVYNAQRIYDAAERDRGAGRDSLADAGYLEVIRRTADAYRSRPSGERVGPTLFLLGRARLRRGELRAAREALEEAVAATDEGALRSEILVYLATTLAGMGDESAALSLADSAIAGGLTGDARGEALLLRGALQLSAGRADLGWIDLDRAAEVGSRFEVEAAVERLRWSVRFGDRERTRVAVARALAADAGGQRIDTIRALLGAAEARWSTRVVADLLQSVDSTAWRQPERGRIRLDRARLLQRTGDTLRASEEAWRVARGRGGAAAEARLLLAHWRLSRSRDLGEAHEVVPILLPAGQHEEVAALLDAMDALDRYSDLGLDRPLGWFAAAEIARDRLGAPVLARGLFMAYADRVPADPWAPKALLAALDVSPDLDDRAWIRGRLEAHRHSPYVLAAHGGKPDGIEALEEELQMRLREIRGG